MPSSDRIPSPPPAVPGQPPHPPSETKPSPSLEDLIPHHQYSASHILQSYDLYIPPSATSASTPPSQGKKPWLILLHGGAWRDPTITARSFLLPTLRHLLHQPPSTPQNPSLPLITRFSGILSLNYRLSPHPSHPQPRPPSTPEFDYRNARHPDHIADVLTGLAALQSRYGFGGDYVLVGHSCGGMLGWQVLMSRHWREGEDGGGGGGGGRDEGEDEDGGGGGVVETPLAIISVCGIYDLPNLVEKHEDVPVYRDFVTAAFASDEQVWEEVSPARWGHYAQSWNSVGQGRGTGKGRPKVVVLAYAEGDELVERGQVGAMEGALRAQQWPRVRRRDVKEEGEGEGLGEDRSGDGKWNVRIKVLELKGAHDEVWQEGREMVRTIEVAMGMLEM